MDNLELYNKVRAVPKEAQKQITGGKLNGKTDINPMWRIKKLTEEFGICGIGWKAPIVERWIDDGARDEKIVNVKIALQVKVGDAWSDVIEGIGGNTITQTEKGQLVSNDEAYKMAYTDAISVACKMLGFGADIYWEKDGTKYQNQATAAEKQEPFNIKEETVEYTEKELKKAQACEVVTEFGKATLNSLKIGYLRAMLKSEYYKKIRRDIKIVIDAKKIENEEVKNEMAAREAMLESLPLGGNGAYGDD